MAGPAVPRPLDRQGRRAAHRRYRAILSRSAAAAARVHQPWRRGACHGRGARAVGVPGHRRPVVQGHPVDHRFAPRRAASSRHRVLAGGRSHRGRRARRGRRAPHGPSAGVARRSRVRAIAARVRGALLRPVAPAARQGAGARTPPGRALRQQARSHDAAAQGASVRADRCADAGHSRNRRRHGE